MKIEEGKKYVTRDGTVRGPMRRSDRHLRQIGYPWSDGVLSWTDDGVHMRGNVMDADLVREFVPPTPWQNAPKFKVGDRVRFTAECPHRWWFGPHTDYKAGVVQMLYGDDGRYAVKVDGQGTALVKSEHIELISAPAAPLAKPVREPRFKAGDKVRFADVCTRNCYWMGPHSKYKTGFVVGWDAEQRCWEVRIPGRPTSNPLYFSDDQIEPVSNPAPVKPHGWIVCLVGDDGRPRPSEVPVVHEDRDGAANEMRRLARKHRGKMFAMYQCMGSHYREDPTGKSWQELAEAGQFHDAVDAFMRLTGGLPHIPI